MKLKTRALFSCACIILLISCPLLGQNSRTIQEKKIASRTVHEYFLEEGLKEPLTESFERYNERGELLEIKEFNSKGEVKRWEKYAYNEEGRLVEEVFLDGKGSIERTEKSLYTDGLRTEKLYYNRKDKLYKRKVYEYEYRK
ncbi:MAG: hypothetical protein P1P86_05960 [Bacteroidales bacterium]|nr:hypothetical protein [Bacteroidales bacterium]